MRETRRFNNTGDGNLLKLAAALWLFGFSLSAAVHTRLDARGRRTTTQPTTFTADKYGADSTAPVATESPMVTEPLLHAAVNPQQQGAAPLPIIPGAPMIVSDAAGATHPLTAPPGVFNRAADSNVTGDIPEDYWATTGRVLPGGGQGGRKLSAADAGDAGTNSATDTARPQPHKGTSPRAPNTRSTAHRHAPVRPRDLLAEPSTTNRPQQVNTTSKMLASRP